MPESEVKGLYTNIGEIENQTLAYIEDSKNVFLTDLHKKHTDTAIIEFSAILNSMIILIQKYFTNEQTIINYRVEGYNIYDIKESVPFAKDIRDLQKLTSIAFPIYNYFSKLIGVSVPTTRHNFKKKIVTALFSVAAVEDINKVYEKTLDDFMQLKYKKNKTNFFCYCLSTMKDYDLDANVLIIGFKRSGKSNYMLQSVRKISAMRLGIRMSDVDAKLLESDFAGKNIFYDKRQDLERALKTKEKQVICIDEGFLVLDRRNAMNKSVIKLTQTLNEYGDKGNVSFTLMQDFTALERRMVNISNAIVFVISRGRAMLFSKDKTFASLVRDLFGFDYLVDNPYIFNQHRDKIIHRLKQMSSYICELKWKKLGDNLLFKDTGSSGNAFYDSYLKNKLMHQKSSVERDDEASGITAAGELDIAFDPITKRYFKPSERQMVQP